MNTQELSPGRYARDVLLLGIGNILWADEGFGPRAAEAFNSRFRLPEGAEVMDGGTLGGWLVEYASWHWIFLINVPVGIAGCIATMKFMPDLRAQRGKLSRHKRAGNPSGTNIYRRIFKLIFRRQRAFGSKTRQTPLLRV